MNILHFAVTPLAGAPFRLTQAITAHTPHTARLVDIAHYGTEDFGHDVIFSENPEEACALAEWADVIHFHNYLEYDSQQFAPIDFHALRRKGVRFIRQFHSHPHLVAKVMCISPVALLRQDIPAIVIGQFQERFYPDAMVVPNPIPMYDAAYLPDASSPVHDVFLSPTRLLSGAADRWNTKGMPETLDVIRRACNATGATWKLMHKTPLKDVLAARRASRIVVDEMVTGSYHLSGLEGLSQGKPVLAWLDDRSQRILRYFSGSEECPFITARVTDAEAVLMYLLEHPEEASTIGQQSRSWMERYWFPEKCLAHFSRAYSLLFDSPEQVTRQPELSLRGKRFFAVTLPNLTRSHIPEH